MPSTLEPTEVRPWGNFTVLLDLPHTKVKHLLVSPGHRLSLQQHAKRQEHWLVVAGSPEITVNDRVWIAQVGEHVFIPQGARHRLSNVSGTVPAELVETQLGSYFGEDDIVRFEDDYNRS